jgi:hypothetical protein
MALGKQTLVLVVVESVAVVVEMSKQTPWPVDWIARGVEVWGMHSLAEVETLWAVAFVERGVVALPVLV